MASDSSSSEIKAKGKGRQKIKMVKISNSSNLQVTFSKRRSGLFKKANELAVLTGASVLAIVFSPGGKVYSFGNPSVEELIQTFLAGNPQPSIPTEPHIQSHREIKFQRLNSNLNNLKNSIEDENKRAKEIELRQGADRIADWSEAPANKLNIKQIQQLALAILDLRDEIERELIKRGKAAKESFVVEPNVGNNYGYNRPDEMAMPTYFGSGNNAFNGGGGLYPYFLDPNPFEFGPVGGGDGYFWAYPIDPSPNGFGGGGLSMAGPSSFAGGNGGSFMPGLSLFSSGDGLGSGGPFTDGPSLFSSGGPFMPGLSLFSSGGPFMAGLTSFGDDGAGNGGSFMAALSLFSSGGPFMAGLTSFGGDGVSGGGPTMDYGDSSSQDGNNTDDYLC